MASLKPALKCGLRFRVVVVILLHATTPGARASLVKILGQMDFTVWLAVLHNPEVDSLILVPASDLVDAESGAGAAEFAKFKAPEGAHSRGTAWVEKMSRPGTSTLESKFGPHHLRTAKAYLLSVKEMRQTAARKEAKKMLQAKLEQRQEAAAERAVVREGKEEAKEEAKEARKQVALTLTLTQTQTLTLP